MDEHQIAGADIEKFLMGLIGGAAGSDDFDRWGAFGNGNFNWGEKDENEGGRIGCFEVRPISRQLP